MAPRPVSAQKIIDLVDEYRLSVTAMNGKGSQFYATQARTIESQIIKLLTSGNNVINDAERARLMSALRGIFNNGTKSVLGVSTRQIYQIAGVSLAHQKRILESGGMDPERVAKTFLRIEKAIAAQELIKVAEPYQALWANMWSDEWVKVGRHIQASLTRAALTGETNRTIANALMGPLGELNIAGHLGPDAFADAFVRTQFGQLHNDFSTALANEAGLDKYVNIGVPDDAQSEICNEASQLSPMTLEEWEASSVGRPTRHVFNCRCILQAVPDSMLKQDFTQPNPKFQEVAA